MEWCWFSLRHGACVSLHDGLDILNLDAWSDCADQALGVAPEAT